MTEQVKISDKFFVYQPDGEGCGDFVAFNGAYGESILDEAECVKMLNGFNNTCAKQAEQIKMLRDALELVRPEIYYNQDGDEIDAGGHFVFMDNGSVDHESMQKIHDALSATEQK